MDVSRTSHLNTEAYCVIHNSRTNIARNIFAPNRTVGSPPSGFGAVTSQNRRKERAAISVPSGSV